MDYIIQHHGILGQKWGVRRFQNPDGSLTPAGKKRYAKELLKAGPNSFSRNKSKRKQYLQTLYDSDGEKLVKEAGLVEAKKKVNDGLKAIKDAELLYTQYGKDNTKEADKALESYLIARREYIDKIVDYYKDASINEIDAERISKSHVLAEIIDRVEKSDEKYHESKRRNN